MIILGSQSPRRREILDFFSLPFEQIPSHFDEESVLFEGDPVKYATLLSQKKAESLALKYPTDVVITADTVVYCKGKVYNKPQDAKQAQRFLIDLGGVWQSVITGVTVRKGVTTQSAAEETKILFHKLTEAQIKKFHDHCYFLDKAGGYAIEKCGNLIVSRMEGCYYNVMGLPINTVQKLLLNLEIDLWDYLKSFS